jgi:uncharacterized membrane protein YfcA
MTEWAIPLVAAAVFVGATAQRVTGVGFALVVAPFLVLAYGPLSGVLVLNLIAAVSALILMVRSRKTIDWRLYRGLAVPALAGIPLGAWVAGVMPTAWLEIAVGFFLLIALSVSAVVGRLAARVTGTTARTAAGFLAGGLSASVGVGGPALTVYAVMTRWEHGSFVATVQPFFVTIALGSFLTKLSFAPERMPDPAWWAWLLIAVAMISGFRAGDAVSRVLPTRTARLAVIGIAVAGGVFTSARGLSALLA